MDRGVVESERSELRDKNLVSPNQAIVPAPLLPLAHSFSNRPGTEVSLVDFIPKSNQFTLVDCMYGFMVWLSGNGIQYLEPDINGENELLEADGGYLIPEECIEYMEVSKEIKE